MDIMTKKESEEFDEKQRKIKEDRENFRKEENA